MSRFHSKQHKFNHHTLSSDGYPDSASDPIASSEYPFKGDFHIEGNIFANSIDLSESLSSLEVDNLVVNLPLSSLSVEVLTLTSFAPNTDGSNLINVNATQLGGNGIAEFVLKSEGNQIEGYAKLDGSAKIQQVSIPDNINLSSLNFIPVEQYLLVSDLSSTVAPLITSDNTYGYELPIDFIPDNIEAKTLNGLSSNEYLQTSQLSSTVAPLITSDNAYGYEVPSELLPSEFSHRNYMGWFDYNASGALSSVTLTANVWNPIENDAGGPFTLTSYGPTGIDRVWDESTNLFDWSQLSLGDTVDIRFDIEVTTTVPNETIEVDLVMAKGTSSEYRITFIPLLTSKNATTVKLSRYQGVYMGNVDTLSGGAQFEVRTDAAATMKVNGWYNRITRLGD